VRIDYFITLDEDFLNQKGEIKDLIEVMVAFLSEVPKMALNS
jgi:hypothetical protein